MNDRPGFRTTEFWLALVVVLGGSFAAIYQDNQLAQVGGSVAAALAAMGYGFARANVKRANLEETSNERTTDAPK